MQHYLYLDHEKEVLIYANKQISMQAPIIFSCYANSISEADKKYKEHFEKDASSQRYIGCVAIGGSEDAHFGCH